MPAEFKRLEIPFTGAWQPGVDPLLIEFDGYSDIKNMRYTDKSIKGVNGFSKINTTPFSEPYDYTSFTEVYVGADRVTVA